MPASADTTRFVIACFIASCLAAGCGQSERTHQQSSAAAPSAAHETPAPAAANPATHAEAPPVPARSVGFFDGSTDEAEIARVRLDAVRRFTPVGTTSVVFKMQLGDGSLTSFRPRTRSHPRGWLAEIAAYRIARALGMDQVPVAAARTIQRDALGRYFDPEKRERLAEIDRNITWNDHDQAIGAAVPWVPHLRDLGFETDEGVNTWAPWLLTSSPMPDTPHIVLARDLSMMLTFDLLIGNFDRMSGGNLKASEDGSRIVIRDHNLAFITPLPEMQRAATERRFMRVERFSRRFVEALRSINEARMRDALRNDALMNDIELLDAAQINDVLSRARTILARIDSLIAQRGENAVLAFE